jgi:hypothetical protein
VEEGCSGRVCATQQRCKDHRIGGCSTDLIGAGSGMGPVAGKTNHRLVAQSIVTLGNRASELHLYWRYKLYWRFSVKEQLPKGALEG